jgi:hypothetical protein
LVNRNRVRGTPIWLFKLPIVARVLYFLERTAWINSFVVVLPLLPVKAMIGHPKKVL